jgi:hypothetical protein
MANPQAQASCTLDAFLGLLTNVAPDAIPEGGSPLNWDCDYLVGEVGTRPGLVSVYNNVIPSAAKYYQLVTGLNENGDADGLLPYSIYGLSWPPSSGNVTIIPAPSGLHGGSFLGTLYVQGSSLFVTDYIAGFPNNFAVYNINTNLWGEVLALPYSNLGFVQNYAGLAIGPGSYWCLDTSVATNLWVNRFNGTSHELVQISTTTGAVLQHVAVPSPENEFSVLGMNPIRFNGEDYIVTVWGNPAFVIIVFKVSDGSILGSYTSPISTGINPITSRFVPYDGSRYLYWGQTDFSSVWYLIRVDLTTFTGTQFTFTTADPVYEFYAARAAGMLIGRTIGGNLVTVNPTTGAVINTFSGLTLDFADDPWFTASFMQLQNGATDDVNNILILPSPGFDPDGSLAPTIRRLNTSNLAAIAAIDDTNPALQWTDGGNLNDTDSQASYYAG